MGIERDLCPQEENSFAICLHFMTIQHIRDHNHRSQGELQGQVTRVTRKQTLRSLSLSYQKKDGRVHTAKESTTKQFDKTP